MDLKTYTSIHSQRRLAEKLGVHFSLVSQWLSGVTNITPERAMQIETATNGAVSRSELRPDIWPKDEDAA